MSKNDTTCVVLGNFSTEFIFASDERDDLEDIHERIVNRPSGFDPETFWFLAHEFMKRMQKQRGSYIEERRRFDDTFIFKNVTVDDVKNLRLEFPGAYFSIADTDEQNCEQFIDAELDFRDENPDWDARKAYRTHSAIPPRPGLFQ